MTVKYVSTLHTSHRESLLLLDAGIGGADVNICYNELPGKPIPNNAWTLGALWMEAYRRGLDFDFDTTDHPKMVMRWLVEALLTSVGVNIDDTFTQKNL